MSDLNVDRMVENFCELVKIPSESYNEEKFIKHLEELFKNMGARTKRDSYGNLIAKFAAKNSTKTESIGFGVHADTVSPGVGIEPVIKDGIISSKGETILAADDKAAIAELIEVLKTAKKHPPVEIIVTIHEEPGTLGSINMDYSLIDSKIAYALDTSMPDEVIIAGPTIIMLDAEYKGVPAHAGICPEKGISAIQAASKAIAKMKLGKLDEDSTANVGVFNGGKIRNGIPDHAKVLAECRSLKHEKALEIASEMEKIFKEAADELGAELTISVKESIKAYSIDENSQVVQNIVAALQKNGIKPRVTTTRGGSDATILNLNGIPTVLIGIGMRDGHSCNETAIIEEMLVVCKTLQTMLETLA